MSDGVLQVFRSGGYCPDCGLRGQGSCTDVAACRSRNEDTLCGVAPPVWIVEIARLRTTAPVDGLSICHGSARGVVLFNAEMERKRISTGASLTPIAISAIVASSAYNGPPIPFTCDGGSLECRERCGKYCVHAEERAIRHALGCDDVEDLELVHVKVSERAVVSGGPPTCWQCSRVILDEKLGGVWLYETAQLGNAGRGWVYRSAEAFHTETLQNCGLIP